jgi:hypothetical protein
MGYDSSWQSSATAVIHYYSYDAMRFIQAVVLKFSEHQHNDLKTEDDDDNLLVEIRPIENSDLK